MALATLKAVSPAAAAQPASGPGVYDLSLYHGDSYRWQFVLWSDAAQTVPLDLTDVTVKAEIRDKPGGSKLAAMTCEVTLPNTVAVVLPASLWTAITFAKGAWDLQLTYLSGEVHTLLAGSVEVTMDVTV